MPEGLRCLEAVAEKHGFQWNFEHFDFASCDYYERHGCMLPPDWVDVLKPFDAIYFGAVGDPKRYPVSAAFENFFIWPNILNDMFIYVTGSYYFMGKFVTSSVMCFNYARPS